MTAMLTVVAENDAKSGKPQTVAARVRSLQAEARRLAKDHILEMTMAMGQLSRLSTEIADGGDAYPAGVRDLARRLSEELDLRLQTVEAIAERTA